MSNFTYQQATIVALFVESVCYGIYLVTFRLCLRTLLWVRKGGSMKPWSQVNHLMLGICLVMPIAATINLSLNIVRAIQSASPGGSSREFMDAGSPMEVSRVVCILFQTLIADFMLIYRTWAIYSKSWSVVIVPIFLWFGVAALGILNLVVLRQTHNVALTAPTPLRPIVASLWATSITLNVIATSLILSRLYRAEKGLSRASVYRLRDSAGQNKYGYLTRIMRIMVESGILYTSAAISLCITYVVGSQGLYVASAIEVQMVGISFNLVIIRVAMAEYTGYPTSEATDTIPLHIVPGPRPPGNLQVLSVTQETQCDQECSREPIKRGTDYTDGQTMTLVTIAPQSSSTSGDSTTTLSH